MRVLRLALAAALLAALSLAGSRPLGPVPPLGSLLDPVNGAWGLVRAARLPAGIEANLPGLGGPVEVVYDDRGVPHIFATSDEDAFRVFGWVQARDRLFQLELTARAGAGRLTELLGARALPADRDARELGLPWASERRVAAIDTSSDYHRALRAYTEGVNAWIAGMTRPELPLEYRLLGRRPTRWEPHFSFYMFAGMSETLARYDPGESRLRVQALVGEEAADALVPVNSPIQEPIEPNGTAPRYVLSPLPPPGASDSAAAVLAAETGAGPRAGHEMGDVTLGSNNWAVAPERTAAGHALLAGDPHLALTLPSIWYEAHLVVPGRFDVAGVALPGAPGIVIGFNRDLAWTFTNTGGDVLDRYVEVVDDSVSPRRYRLDGDWVPLALREEVYRDPRGRTVAVDTVRYTHRGPMVKRGRRWISTRWTAHQASREGDLFLRAARARTAEEWLGIMAEYVAPTQNGLVADRHGTIAIRSSGAYPRRPGDGRGDRLFDGQTRNSDWTGELPVERYPFSLRPTQGFLASANQQPVDPVSRPDFLGADWPGPWRAMRINALLRRDSAMTAEAMRRMQTDPGSARAEAFLPFFIGAAQTELAAGRGDAGLDRALALLTEWDGTYRPDNQRTILFEMAMRELPRRLWDELIRPDSAPRGPVYSSSATLYQALVDSTSVWWDDRRTPEAVETRNNVLAASLAAALDSVLSAHGDPDAGGWSWGTVWPTDINHLLNLPGLSARGVAVQGGPETIAPAGRRGRFGASWRMVVELGERVQGWATYPGGQSGNPASALYANRIPQWARGDLDSVLVPETSEALPPDRIRGRIRFTPGGGR